MQGFVPLQFDKKSHKLIKFNFTRPNRQKFSSSDLDRPGTASPLIKFSSARALLSVLTLTGKAGIIFNRINRTKNEHLNIVSGNQKWTNSGDDTLSTLIEIAFNAAKVTQSATLGEKVEHTF